MLPLNTARALIPFGSGKAWLCALLVVTSSLLASASGPFFISEILFNPPGPDAPNEYIEIRGAPNSSFPAGSYLVGIEGDAADNPGEIQDLFDLSGRILGANGFLVLLQKTNSYAPHPLSRVLAQTGPDPGWGHGDGSSVRHRGQARQTDLENASVTFMLVQSSKPPSIGDDLDSDDDGVLDGDLFESWRVYDSVGILDPDGAGDIVYAAINFRRLGLPGSGAKASGVVVPVSFTPSYVGRIGNSVGYTPADWVASDSLQGAAPQFRLGDAAHSTPSSLGSAPLNHLGAPNFGAPALFGVAISGPINQLPMHEEGSTNAYTVALTVQPLSEVSLQLSAEEGLEVSVDSGVSFSSRAILRMKSTDPYMIQLRTTDDDLIQRSPRLLQIYHKVLPGGDPSYTDAITPSIAVYVLDNEMLLLNEVLANPVGTDVSRQFIELRGTPGAMLQGVSVVAIEGKAADNPGTIEALIDLDGVRLGQNGLLFLSASDQPYAIEPRTRFIADERFGQTNGFLPKDTLSLLVVASPVPLIDGDDLDHGDNGQLEGLPKGTTILDSISWLHGAIGDVAYGPVLSDLPNLYPDAATRFPGNNRASTASAWFYGDLKGDDPQGLHYDRQLSSPNLPPAAVLTPGVLNNTPPVISKVEPMAGALDDPTNPSVTFSVTDAESPPAQIEVAATSSNPGVVPDQNLELTPLGSGLWRLDLDPIEIGYSTIQIRATDGELGAQMSFRYAASRGGDSRTRFLMGSGDGSTAIPVSGNRILVGDDENQVLRLYDRDRSGYPLDRFDITPFLELTDIEKGVPREVDIEGSTRAGNRLFWMGAHSHASVAEIRTNRSRIFATDLKDEGGNVSLSYVGRYDYLKVDLVQWDENNGHGKGSAYYGLKASTQEGVDPKALDGSGFNLEGLSMAPGSTQVAYVACRAPQVPAAHRTHALIVPVLNFAALAAGSGPPGSAVFGDPIELDLFGRGIRSLEGIGTNFLIIAGPAGPVPTNYPNDFRLYTWTGAPSDAPQLRAASLAGLNPEGIVELPELPWTPDREVQLLSDCGTAIWYGDGVITKLLPTPNFKKSRLDWVKIGPVVLPEPLLLEVIPSQASTTVRWRGAVGQRYRLQWTADISQPIWSDIPGDVVSVQPVVSKQHWVSPAVGRRYYRVRMLP